MAPQHVSFTIVLYLLCTNTSTSFLISPHFQPRHTTTPYATKDQPIETITNDAITRRNTLIRILTTTAATTLPFLSSPSTSHASTFTPGGTLVDRDVGVTVGNPDASPSRDVKNANVLFQQDHYFKFGVAAPWIEPDSTEFPKTMPFVLSQQRYDALKKHGERVTAGAKTVRDLGGVIREGGWGGVNGGDDPVYALRPYGLLANSFLASENTGTTNELFLARWYINEIYLRVGDIKASGSKEEALKAHDAAMKAVNSYFAMMNRVITSKVGNKFEYI